MSNSNKIKGISRRDFLKGTAAGALGVAAAGLLGGCASTTEKQECPPCESTSSASSAGWPAVEALEPKVPMEGVVAFVKEPIADSEIVKTENVDVVVCGMGPAGFAASIASAQQGLKTVVLEKGRVGTYRSATIGGLTDRIHKKYGVEFDTKQWLDDAMVNSMFYGNQAIYQRWIDTQEEAINWFLDLFGLPDEDFKLTFAAGDFPDFYEPYDITSLSRSWNTSINIPLAPAEIVELLTSKVKEAGAEVLMETPACQLIKEDGKVVGVIARTAEGYVKYLCAKGVVLATGGYEFNPTKLKECCRPRDLALNHWMNGTASNTGDGHEMGKAVGAIEDEYPHPLMLDPAQLMPYLRVNKLGKRFTPEYEPYNHLALAMQNQPGAINWYITDGDAAGAIDKMWTPSSSCYGPKEVWVGAATSENALKADTLEELAGLMGVPADAFVETINHWNAMCEAGEDTDFHMLPSMMHPIKTAPFYANLEGAAALCTAGGLQITPNSEVLDTEFNVIPGLYAIGNVSGSMFHGTYPHNLNCISHSRCITFGYNVAKLLASK